MDDVVVFDFLKDTTIPENIRKDLKNAYECLDKQKVQYIIEKILLVKTTSVFLGIK